MKRKFSKHGHHIGSQWEKVLPGFCDGKYGGT
jgi:hypothetical protein